MALDNCHQQMVNALAKAGWEIYPKSPYFRLEDILVIPDIWASHPNGTTEQIIVVEVKCFSNEGTDQDELYRAIGQYLIYRNVLKVKRLSYKLYLAVPLTAYNRVFTSTAVSLTTQEAKIKMLVIDIDLEEINLWLD